MAKKKAFTNSAQVLEFSMKIMNDKDRKLNKMGEWLKTRDAAPFTFDKKDMRYIVR